MKMPVLIVCGPLVGGGAEKVLIDMLSNFDYDRYEVDLALIHKYGVYLEKVPRQVNIIELWPEKSLHHFVAVKFSTKLHSNCVLASRMNSRRLRSDYVAEIAFLEGWATKLLSLRRSPGRKIAWLHTDRLHLHASLSCYHNPQEERKVYGGMDAVVCVSEDSRKSLVSLVPECVANATVIHNPVDKELVGALALNEENPYGRRKEGHLTVVSVGRLSKEKNPWRWLQVAALSKAEGLPLSFVWVGDGALMEELKAKAREMQMDDIVKFAGFRKNPYPYIRHADIMLLPSDAEGFSIVTCEAMCLGTPVVSTATAGQGDLLGNDECGLVTDFTPEALLDALRRLVSDPALRGRLASNALRRIEEFTPARMLSRLYRLI